MPTCNRVNALIFPDNRPAIRLHGTGCFSIICRQDTFNVNFIPGLKGQAGRLVHQIKSFSCGVSDVTQNHDIFHESFRNLTENICQVTCLLRQVEHFVAVAVLVCQVIKQPLAGCNIIHTEADRNQLDMRVIFQSLCCVSDPLFNIGNSCCIWLTCICSDSLWSTVCNKYYIPVCCHEIAISIKRIICSPVEILRIIKRLIRTCAAAMRT